MTAEETSLLRELDEIPIGIGHVERKRTVGATLCPSAATPFAARYVRSARTSVVSRARSATRSGGLWVGAVFAEYACFKPMMVHSVTKSKACWPAINHITHASLRRLKILVEHDKVRDSRDGWDVPPALFCCAPMLVNQGKARANKAESQ